MPDREPFNTTTANFIVLLMGPPDRSSGAHDLPPRPTRESGLVVRHCQSCEALQFDQRQLCLQCGSSNVHLRRVSGLGAIIESSSGVSRVTERETRHETSVLAAVQLLEHEALVIIAEVLVPRGSEAPVGTLVEVETEHTDRQQIVFRIVLADPDPPFA